MQWGSLTSTVPTFAAVEREWTKALCGNDSAALSRLNAAMKRIDLTCLIASPILVGTRHVDNGGILHSHSAYASAASLWPS